MSSKSGAVMAACALALTGCRGQFSPSASSSTLSGSGSSVAGAVPSGPKVAKFILSTGVGGSYNGTAPSALGTPPILGSGFRARNVYNADNTLLSPDPASSTWPKWIEYFEVTLSGGNNVDTLGNQATNTNCARFSSALDTAALCDLNLDGVFAENCGAAAGYWRVSEYDCSAATSLATAAGGTKSDPIAIRVKFRRDAASLGTSENIMAVIEYTAAAVHPGPTSPTDCFSGTGFAPDNANCSDSTWKAFLNVSTSTAAAQPFQLLVPPANTYITNSSHRNSGTMTKQIILPLSSDSTLDLLQISRVFGTSSFTVGGLPTCVANSALCVGMTVYSVTLYRM